MRRGALTSGHGPSFTLQPRLVAPRTTSRWRHSTVGVRGCERRRVECAPRPAAALMTWHAWAVLDAIPPCARRTVAADRSPLQLRAHAACLRGSDHCIHSKPRWPARLSNTAIQTDRRSPPALNSPTGSPPLAVVVNSGARAPSVSPAARPPMPCINASGDASLATAGTGRPCWPAGCWAGAGRNATTTDALECWLRVTAARHATGNGFARRSTGNRAPTCCRCRPDDRTRWRCADAAPPPPQRFRRRLLPPHRSPRCRTSRPHRMDGLAASRAGS